MSVNYKIEYIEPTEHLEKVLQLNGGFGIFIDTGILVDGALNNFRFKAYRKLFDELFIKSDLIVLETSIINIIEAMKVLLYKAAVHFVVDEITHHEQALNNIQNFIWQHYEDILRFYGKPYIRKLKTFINKYEINVDDSIYIMYEDKDIEYALLEDENIINILLVYGKKIDYNDLLSLSAASQLEDDIFITTDKKLKEAIKNIGTSSIHIFPYVYSLADKKGAEELLKELMNEGLIQDYGFDEINEDK